MTQINVDSERELFEVALSNLCQKSAKVSPKTPYLSESPSEMATSHFEGHAKGSLCSGLLACLFTALGETYPQMKELVEEAKLTEWVKNMEEKMPKTVAGSARAAKSLNLLGIVQSAPPKQPTGLLSFQQFIR